MHSLPHTPSASARPQFGLKRAAIAALALITPALGVGEWSSAYSSAKSSLAKMSLQDKVDMVTGEGWKKGPCVGTTKAIPSIGYPRLCLQDGPLG